MRIVFGFAVGGGFGDSVEAEIVTLGGAVHVYGAMAQTYHDGAHGRAKATGAENDGNFTFSTVSGGTYGDMIVFAYGGIIGFDPEDYDSYSQYSGVIFCNGEALVCGTVTLDRDSEIPDNDEDYNIDGFTLNIPEESTLSIPSDITVTNLGSIEVCGGLYNYGDVSVSSDEKGHIWLYSCDNLHLGNLNEYDHQILHVIPKVDVAVSDAGTNYSIDVTATVTLPHYFLGNQQYLELFVDQGVPELELILDTGSVSHSNMQISYEENWTKITYTFQLYIADVGGYTLTIAVGDDLVATNSDRYYNHFFNSAFGQRSFIIYRFAVYYYDDVLVELDGNYSYNENKHGFTIEKTLTRDRFTFLGWSNNPDAAVATHPVSNLSVTWIGTSQNPNLLLYTLQSQVTYEYTLEYDPNKGSWAPSVQMETSALASLEMIVISEELVRDGYEFARWNDMANGSGRSYVEGQTITFYRESLELIL